MIIADIIFFKDHYFLYDTVSSAIWTLNMKLDPPDQFKMFRKLSNISISDLNSAKKTFARWMILSNWLENDIVIVRTDPWSISSIELSNEDNLLERPEQKITFTTKVK